MGILKKVKNLVSGNDAAEEAKPKKRATSKKAVVAESAKTEAAHDHADHAGHDHAAHEGAAHEERPQSAAGAVGFAAARHIVRALITEKGTIAGQFHTYLFQVALAANKGSIRQAIERIYGVKVTKVHTLRQDGKSVRSGKIQGRRSNFKKAYVTVAKGQTISVHKGI